jgi:hypothetical protein
LQCDDRDAELADQYETNCMKATCSSRLSSPALEAEGDLDFRGSKEAPVGFQKYPIADFFRHRCCGGSDSDSDHVD